MAKAAKKEKAKKARVEEIDEVAAPNWVAGEVALGDLKVSPFNVRKHSASGNIESLVASIKSHGLLSPLVVYKEGDFFEVVAGQRRLLALQKIHGKNLEEKIPVRMLKGEIDPVEISLAENFVREKMSAADEFHAFKKLTDEGNGAKTVAQRFSVTEKYVLQRLELAALSPKVLKALEKEEITLEMAEAFTVGAHKKQEAVLAGEPTDVDDVMRYMSDAAVTGDDKRLKIVGLKAYEKAGGYVHKSLFDDTYVVLEDEGLLNSLVDAKLEEEAQKLRDDGWKAVEVRAVFPYAEQQKFDRVRKTKYTKADKEECFAVVTIGWEGIETELGFKKKGAAKKSKSAAKGGADAADEDAGLSKPLEETLNAYRNAALAVAMKENPALAVRYVAFSMWSEVSGQFESAMHGGFRISHAFPDGDEAANKACDIEEFLSEIPDDADKALNWFLQEASDDKISEAISVFASVCISKHYSDSFEKMYAAFKPDASNVFTPTAENFFGKLDTKTLTEIVVNQFDCVLTGKEKKKDLAAIAEKQMPAGWLPEFFEVKGEK